MNQTEGPLFPNGFPVVTAGALMALAKSRTQPEELLDRHVRGDFGEVDEKRRQANLAAMTKGGPVVSIFTMKSGDRLQVVTAANRSSTTIMLESET